MKFLLDKFALYLTVSERARFIYKRAKTLSIENQSAAHPEPYLSWQKWWTNMYVDRIQSILSRYYVNGLNCSVRGPIKKDNSQGFGWFDFNVCYERPR